MQEENPLWILNPVLLLSDNIVLQGFVSALNINGARRAHGQQRFCHLQVKVIVCCKCLKELQPTLDATAIFDPCFQIINYQVSVAVVVIKHLTGNCDWDLDIKRVHPLTLMCVEV